MFEKQSCIFGASMTTERFNQLEKYFFPVIILLNVFPVLINQFVPTMDGAAHLYNSNIINSMLFEGETSLHDFFTFNREPVPNWIGHFILSVFNLLLPAYVAEKILILFYLIALPLSFRSLVKEINPDNNLLSYLIFPFSYSFLFLLGFYNFSIALIFLFMGLKYWISIENKRITPKKILVLFLLTTVTYFSHILVFGLLVFCVGLLIAFNCLTDFIADKSDKGKEILLGALQKAGKFLLAAFIPLTLFIYYFLSRGASDNHVFLEYSQLVEWLKEIRPIIVYNNEIESAYTKKIFYILAAVSIIAIYHLIDNRFFTKREPSTKTKRAIILNSDVWLVILISVLVAYFILPDSDGSAGFVSVRLALLFFIFLILWLSTRAFAKWFVVFSVLAVLYCNFRLTVYYSSVMNDLNKVAVDCYNIAEDISPNSVVLPINYSDNWLTGHFSNYLGADKPMVILENYESNTGYFPINWNDSKIPQTIFGNDAQDKYSCLYWKSGSLETKVSIDYVFILGNMDAKNDSCTAAVKNNLSINYSLVSSNDNCRLYKRNI